MNSRPIRVLYLASTASKSGGSLHSLVDLAKQLKAWNVVDPYVVLPDHGSGEELLRDADLRYMVCRSYGAEWPLGVKKPLRQRISHFRQRLENLRAIRLISKYAKNQRIDIVHINTSVDEIGYYVAKRIRVPFVWHIREFVQESHGIDFYNPKKQMKHIASSKTVITISKSLFERYSVLLPNTRIKMVHNGINPSFFPPKRKTNYHGPLRIVSVGRVSKLKGHDDIIAAAEKLISWGVSNFHILFVGDYDDCYPNRVEERGLSSKISFLGYSDSIPEILSMADIHISASPWETFGRVTVEAMMAGCLAIGVDNAGTKDIIIDGKTGYLYPMHDVNALAIILKECILDRRMAEAVANHGSGYARKHFSIEKYASEVLRIYDSLTDPVGKIDK